VLEHGSSTLLADLNDTLTPRLAACPVSAVASAISTSHGVHKFGRLRKVLNLHGIVCTHPTG
jgi:hypothetical protein